MKVGTWVIIGAAVVALASLLLWRLMDHDLERHESAPFAFAVEDHRIAGTLWLPFTAPRAAVVFVHGDGPQDRTAGGGYAPLINVFLDRGIAVAAWDKPGVGGSEGNWLHQSMAARATETRAALAALRARFGALPIGAVGFSQAGWVLPRLSPEDAEFLVLVGPAVSWQAQGDYFTRTRLALEGMAEGAITEALADQDRADARAFGAAARPSDAPEGMSPDRWRFVRENRLADARPALAGLELPLFAIWGAADLNVDARAEAAIYEALLGARDVETQVVLWPEATHGLLKARAYNWQLTEQWSRAAMLRFLLEGRHAFAPGTLEAMTDWILARASRTGAL
ncbi:alpha/beta hydrolase [Roseobacter sp. A03A-229]